MATVEFAWSPILVGLRREVCPNARWNARGRQWFMSDDDAQRFVQAAHRRLNFVKGQAQINIDGVVWMIGFVRGAPYRVA